MGDLGFWALAQEDPDHLALVTPEGEEMSAGARWLCCAQLSVGSPGKRNIRPGSEGNLINGILS